MRLLRKVKNSRGEEIFKGLSGVEIENIMSLVYLHLKKTNPYGEWPTAQDVKDFVMEDGEEMQAIRIPWEEARAEANARNEKATTPLKVWTHECENHKPVQHRDGKPPWCRECGLDKNYQEPISIFNRQNHISKETE